MSVGESGVNLLNNILRHICFRFPAFGNGNDDDVQKLPKECLKLELFGTVLMARILRKKISGNVWLDTELEPSRQAVHEDLANDVIEGTFVIRGDKFILRVCN